MPTTMTARAAAAEAEAENKQHLTTGHMESSFLASFEKQLH
jgi:hypothetical protein